MLETLLTSLGIKTHPFEGFLGELWTVWTRDAGRAVLLARWSWQNLPGELISQAIAVQQQAHAAQAASEIDQQVSTQLGAMGIFLAPGSMPSVGFGMDPDHAIFIIVMGMIRAHRGDPPASPGMVQLAEAVLRGQSDPVAAMISSASPLVRQQLVIAAQMLKMTGMYQFLQLQAVVQAALSLPRKRIPILLPEVSSESPGDKFRNGLQAAYDNFCTSAEPGVKTAARLVFHAIAAAAVNAKVLDMTDSDVTKMSTDELIRRLTDLGWLKLRT